MLIVMFIILKQFLMLLCQLQDVNIFCTMNIRKLILLRSRRISTPGFPGSDTPD